MVVVQQTVAKAVAAKRKRRATRGFLRRSAQRSTGVAIIAVIEAVRVIVVSIINEKVVAAIYVINFHGDHNSNEKNHSF